MIAFTWQVYKFTSESDVRTDTNSKDSEIQSLNLDPGQNIKLSIIYKYYLINKYH